MCRTMPYVIPFKGLKEGDYEFDFKVGDSLFESYSRAEILGGDCTAHIDRETCWSASRTGPTTTTAR